MKEAPHHRMVHKTSLAVPDAGLSSSAVAHHAVEEFFTAERADANDWSPAVTRRTPAVLENAHEAVYQQQ